MTLEDLPQLAPSAASGCGPSRRVVLGAAGVLGFAAVADFVVAGLTGGTAQALTASSDCALTSPGEEGPFFVDVKLDRSDVCDNSDGTNAQAGIPLTLNLTLYGDSSCATPLEGAYVDIWSANAQGVYSDESSEQTVGDTWLRGYQVSGEDGAVSFSTIYPGWYSGRTIHIHARIRTYDSASVVSDFETQFFFDESTNATVLATSAYRRTSSRDTTNSTDRVYAGEAADTGVNLLTLTGDTSKGYTGSLDLHLAAASATTTSTGTPAPNEVAAKLTYARVKQVDGHRALVLGIRTDEKVLVKAYVSVDGGSSQVIKQTISAGTHTLTSNVPNALGRGNGKITIGLVDVAGAYKRITVNRYVPAH